ncbi:patatin [Zhengella mangrovi]|uniref:Patatin n=1 Tax=Zhengella mangrovi TaxID=1982044 RepID=A0A2G1QKK6_9HYPH|nr:patatin-like phospholipase family protein [Zhengella mangrovi]PHP66063.1 patatin [Zhengella mangrovi]
MAKGNGKTGPQSRPVNLALQGGGSHGAFTWGVLDRLLEDDRIAFDAVSGTSAGAMNAVALADGWVRGGREGARERLGAFWRAVGMKGRFSPFQRTPWDMLLGNWSVANNPAYMVFDFMSRMVSPAMANPLGINPLREVVETEIDFDNVRACESMTLFISATSVQTGQLKVFTDGHIDADTVMASACLPTIFQPVRIGDEDYWDGGYGGNPALFPFFYTNTTDDVLLVQINPIRRAETPATAREIQNRIEEITFNAALLREFRAIAFVKKLIENGNISHQHYRDIRMHRIDADEALAGLSADSKISAEWEFLKYMRDLGRAAAEDWLEEDFRHVGHRAGIDLSGELDPAMAPVPRHGLGRRVRDFMAARRQPHH